MRIRAVTIVTGFWVLAGFSSTCLQAAAIIDENTGLTSPEKIVIDFGENLVTVGTAIDTQFLGDGVSFGPGFAYNNIDQAYPALTQGYLENLDPSGQPGSILFSSDVTAADFSWRTMSNTQTTFRAYNDNVLVEAFTAGTNVALRSGRYFGFQDIVFDEIRLSVADANKAFTLDNLEYVAAIPVPAAFWLFGSGLVGLIGLAGRKA